LCRSHRRGAFGTSFSIAAKIRLGGLRRHLIARRYRAANKIRAPRAGRGALIS
jgi:hypothetical protein